MNNEMTPRGTRIGSLVLMQVRQQVRSNMSLSYARSRLLKLPLTWPLKRAVSLQLFTSRLLSEFNVLRHAVWPLSSS